MGGETNREKIISSTIDLLIRDGYENISMRHIAEKTGIRASSIYNHFESKEAVLNEVVAIFREELHRRKVNDPDISIEIGDPESALLRIMTDPLKLLEDPGLKKISKVVIECQYYHLGIREFLVEEVFEKPLRLIRSVLIRLIEQGLIIPFPVDFLAAELQSVFVASFYKISLNRNIADIDVREMYKAIRMHVGFFMKAAKR